MRKVLIIILVLISVVFLYISFFDTYSDGTRVGHVVKLSHKGLVLKTWEAQLDVAGSATDVQGRVLWEFSIDDPAIVKQVEAAQTQGKRVKIHYQEELYVAPWRGETKYIADQVDIVESGR